MKQETKFDFARSVQDQIVIDLTESLVSLDLCQRWLQNAFNASNDETFRSLIGDVMAELKELGSTNGELGSLVLGALGSVQSAMELQDLDL